MKVIWKPMYRIHYIPCYDLKNISGIHSPYKSSHGLESRNILGQMRKINVTIHKKIFNSKFSPIVKIGSFIEIIGAN